MKKRARTATKRWAIGTIGLLALGIGTSFQNGALLGEECHPNSDSGARSARNVQHELVPHVVLPETIQYNKISRSHRAHPGLDSAGDYGMVSPYVATYTPFPSYQLPMATQLRAVNQSVYPVSPQAKPLPLPKKDEPIQTERVLAEKDAPESDTDVAPILLASAREDVVTATPQGSLSDEVTQTGIFCQKPAKAPAAWSFNSPLFKAASVPMGWGTPGHAGYISQCGKFGSSQVGFDPMMGGGGAMPGMMPGMMGGQLPMHQFQMGAGPMGAGNGPQIQMLPNGMLMVSMQPDHGRCGIFRCRCGNQPQTIFLPAGMGGMQGMMPGMMPSGMPDAMQQQMPQQMPQPMVTPQTQMAPVTMMTQFGPMVVGYRPMPVMQNPMMAMMAQNPMMAHPAYAWQMQQQMAQQQQWAQYQAMQYQAMQQWAMQQMYAQQMMQQAAAAGKAQDGSSTEPKAPLPINGPNLSAFMVNPYAQYSQQAGTDDGQASNENAENPANPANPMNAMMPGMMMPMQAMPPMQACDPAAFGMTYGMASPYGMGYDMSGMMPGMMNVGNPYGGQFGNPYMMTGGPGQMGMADVIQLAMLLNNNNGKKERRFRLFQRIAERREARRERKSGNDPMNQLMQAWCTPYMASDMVARMPSRNMYPYGYFGAQIGPQETANYGGFYNMYTGNTTFPGLY